MVDVNSSSNAMVQKCDVLAVNDNRMMRGVGLWLSSQWGYSIRRGHSSSRFR
jgi:hypothetical protein